MLLWFADETGFYYHTAKTKSLYSQMKTLEASFIRNADKPEFEMLRVTGTVEILNDQALEEHLKEERAWLWGNIQQSAVDTEVVIFRISHGSAYIWNMEWNMREAEAPRVAF